MSSDTPRSDAARIKHPDGSIIDLVPYGFVVPYDFARQLEWENDSLRRAYVRPDDLREQLAAKTAALEKAQGALKPFAGIAKYTERLKPETGIWFHSSNMPSESYVVTVQHVRDAARAASTEEGAK